MTNDDWKKEFEKYKALMEAKEQLETYYEEQEAADETPDHYNHPIQPWDYMKSLFSEEEFEAYLVGNVIKYVSRYRDKGGVRDIEKAQTYIKKLLTVL